jgi:hypothetical protein
MIRTQVRLDEVEYKLAKKEARGIFSINWGRSGRFPRRTEIHRFGSLFDQFRQ